MTTIRATCPTCGEVDLTPDDIRLTVVRTTRAEVGPDSHYTFTCPSCDESVAKPATERIARLLMGGGVETGVVDRSHPAASGRRPTHPESPPEGRHFTADDLLDFHLLLEEDGWFDLLERSLL
ncbi:MAG: hypothetical protein ACRDUY_07085 [Nitriliruptorales bacterium]